MAVRLDLDRLHLLGAPPRRDGRQGSDLGRTLRLQMVQKTQTESRMLQRQEPIIRVGYFCHSPFRARINCAEGFDGMARVLRKTVRL